MIEYIYIVKCPNCEDEHFHFFDEAKACAMGYISDKPIITQVEVERNDFGECTDSHDLGTVWSWEDVMKDIPAEPEATVFSKSETFGCACKNGGECTCGGDCKCQHDPEFDDDDFFTFEAEDLPLDEGFRVSFDNKEDQNEFFKLCRETGMYTPADLDRFMKEYEADDSNLLDKLREYKAEIDSWDIEESCERKPIPEGMTIEQLVEEMEENEDAVECTWCNDLFDKSECRKEVDLGWLCSRCEAAIKSRGEPLTFRENNYWDFLDEEVEEPEAVHDLGNTYDGSYPESDSTLCPECGKETFDVETGICVTCGFN